MRLEVPSTLQVKKRMQVLFKVHVLVIKVYIYFGKYSVHTLDCFLLGESKAVKGNGG